MIALAEVGDLSVSCILRDIEESHQEKSPYEGAMGQDAFRNETVNIAMNMIEMTYSTALALCSASRAFVSLEMRM